MCEVSVAITRLITIYVWSRDDTADSIHILAIPQGPADTYSLGHTALGNRVMPMFVKQKRAKVLFLSNMLRLINVSLI